MSWMCALSVGSIFQNIVFYLFLLFLGHINYVLITAKSDKKRYAPLMPDRKIIDLALAGSNTEMERVLENVSDAVYMVDRDWNFTFINKAYEKLQRRERVQLLGKNIWEMFPYGKQQRYFQKYDYALRKQVSVYFEEFNAFNGMWISASAHPVKNGLAICFRDITEEKLSRVKTG